MINFGSFYGIIIDLIDIQTRTYESSGCYKLMTVQDDNESLVNFIISPNTYFVDHITVTVGDVVTGYYDADAPVPLIYPPQLQAIVVAKDTKGVNIKVDYFDEQLTSSDGMLKIDPTSYTEIVLLNDQLFLGDLNNRNLIVIYGSSTRSIPAQTTPFKIIVMCV